MCRICLSTPPQALSAEGRAGDRMHGRGMANTAPQGRSRSDHEGFGAILRELPWICQVCLGPCHGKGPLGPNFAGPLTEGSKAPAPAQAGRDLHSRRGVYFIAIAHVRFRRREPWRSWFGTRGPQTTESSVNVAPCSVCRFVAFQSLDPMIGANASSSCKHWWGPSGGSFGGVLWARSCACVPRHCTVTSSRWQHVGSGRCQAQLVRQFRLWVVSASCINHGMHMYVWD